MSAPYNKHDCFAGRDLTVKERLEPQRIIIEHAIEHLNIFRDILDHASDHLTEEQLLIICSAVDNALAAAQNARFLGTSGYIPQPVDAVKW